MTKVKTISPPKQGYVPVWRKVKLDKKNDFLSISHGRMEADKTITEVNENHRSPVHPDLKDRLDDLRIHLALLCGYLSTRQVKDIDSFDQELIDTFKVTGISIGGNDDDEGIVITGQKTTWLKKVVILNSPFAKVEEIEATRYRYMDDLEKKIDALFDEVLLYVEGKHGQTQPELEFPEAELVDEAADGKEKGNGQLLIEAEVPAGKGKGSKKGKNDKKK